MRGKGVVAQAGGVRATGALKGQAQSVGAVFKTVYVGALVITAPGILLWVVLAGLSALSASASTRNGWLAVLLTAASGLLVVAYLRIGKSATRRVRWLWFSTALILVVAASCPAVMSFGGAVAEEWCESQPGGRGYAGNESPEDAPLLCR
jgi:chromate transport protein ChrA